MSDYRREYYKKEFIGFLCIVAFAIFAFIFTQNEKNEIVNNAAIANATVVESLSGYRGGVDIRYYFLVNGKYNEGYYHIDKNSSYKSFFLNKHFPVIYSSKKPKCNALLILREDFERYNRS